MRNSLAASPFLDISGKVNFDAEQGLVGLAFHPSYSQHPLFYLDYDRMLPSGQLQTVIAEYQLSADPNQANAGSERILLTINQPAPNHKGGKSISGRMAFSTSPWAMGASAATGRAGRRYWVKS